MGTLESIPLSRVLRQCDAVKAAGLSPEAMLQSALMTPRYGDDRDRFTPTQYLLLHVSNILSVRDGSQAFGRTSMALDVGYLALAAMVGCDTLEAGLSAYCAMHRLTTDTVRVAFATDADEVRVYIELAGRSDRDASFFEDSLATWLFACVSYFIGAPAPITAFITRDSDHFNLGHLHWAVRVPVRLGRATELRMNRSVLARRRRCVQCDDPMNAAANSWLNFIEGVAAEAPRSSHKAKMTLGMIGRHTGLSVSTLRRRFKASDGGYRLAHQREMSEAGIVLLRGGNQTVEDIAADLGYADAQSFRRMIKSTTGFTPQAIRAGALAVSPSKAELHRRIHDALHGLAPVQIAYRADGFLAP